MSRIPRKPRLFIGHLERYLWTTQYVYKKKVLDMGSKDGYGSHLMSGFANSVTLLDNKLWWLSKAEALYKFLCPYDLEVKDLEIEFSNKKFDVIVAFEIIEHVQNREQLMENIVKALEDGGKLLFSVPHMIPNPDHTHLYDEEGIKDFIGQYMEIEEFYIQDKIIISNKPHTSPPISYVGVAVKKK